jgi:hypothetical protein
LRNSEIHAFDPVFTLMIGRYTFSIIVLTLTARIFGRKHFGYTLKSILMGMMGSPFLSVILYLSYSEPIFHYLHITTTY